MKRPAWRNAGDDTESAEDYHGIPSAPYLPVPAGTSGLEAATTFDRFAVECGYSNFLRRVIPGEFTFTGHGTFSSPGERHKLSELLTQASPLRQIELIEERGLQPAVLVRSLGPGARHRQVVSIHPLTAAVEV